MEPLLYLLLAQAVMSVFDTVYHHALKVGLPHPPGAATALRIHGIRAILYALLCGGLAWYEWHGVWGWVLVALVAMEVLLTLWDFGVEGRSRMPPSSERITHLLLAINGGAALTLLALMLPAWLERESRLVLASYGWLSWLLSLGALGMALSGVREALAAGKLPQPEVAPALDLGRHRRILVTGGTGFIGSALCRALLQGGHEVTLVSRKPLAAAMQFGGQARVVRSAAGLDAEEIFDAVINLAGAPVVGLPWTAKRKAVLRGSRLNTTRDLIAFVRRAKSVPATWIQASAIGYYGPRADGVVTESSPRGSGFAAELCSEWEQLTEELAPLGVRRIVLRFGLVFGRSGGSLPLMLIPFRFGLGSVMGTGNQHVAWIHLNDVLRLMAWSIRDASVSGVINAVAPDCPDYRSFAGQIGEVLHRPVLLRIPAAPMRMVLGEMASMLVDGPEIISQRLPATDFRFSFPTLRSALGDLA